MKFPRLSFRKTEAQNRSLTIDQLGQQLMQYQGHYYGLGIGGGTLAQGQEDVEASFQGYVEGVYKRSGVVFACMAVRMAVFSEARFQFRQIRNGRPGDLFGTAALKPLEKPWPNGTTGDLLARILQDADLAGNAFIVRHGGRLIRLRPDWVTIVKGSRNRDAVPDDLSWELAGYSYIPGGPASGEDAIPLLPEQVAHFAPTPDPLASHRGMSWLTPVLRDILGDSAATNHKIKFYENGATPNLVVAFDPTVNVDAVKKYVDGFKEQHEGVENAYKTLFLGGGADARALGSDFKQQDFKAVQGANETRIAAAAGTPPILVGLSEGLESGTYNNYGLAQRRFADATMRPLWRNLAGSLASIIDVPGGSELWYDERDVAFLRADQKDVAEVQSTQATAASTLIAAGFEPDSVVKSINADDWSLLKHSGLVSVQLQEPGATAPEPVPSSNGNGPSGVPILIP